jgi:hypothetical protein
MTRPAVRLLEILESQGCAAVLRLRSIDEAYDSGLVLHPPAFHPIGFVFLEAAIDQGYGGIGLKACGAIFCNEKSIVDRQAFSQVAIVAENRTAVPDGED